MRVEQKILVRHHNSVLEKLMKVMIQQKSEKIQSTKKSRMVMITITLNFILDSYPTYSHLFFLSKTLLKIYMVDNS